MPDLLQIDNARQEYVLHQEFSVFSAQHRKHSETAFLNMESLKTEHHLGRGYFS
jgi:hypothetical protein